MRHLVRAPLRRLFQQLSPHLPAVVAFPAAPSDGPTLAYPSDPAYLPAESSYAPDAALAPGADDDAAPDSDAAEETHDAAQQLEQPEDEQQLPRQIHIQQHLKLHFHNQGKFLCESSVQMDGLEPSHRMFRNLKMCWRKKSCLSCDDAKALPFLFEKYNAVACNIMYAYKT